MIPGEIYPAEVRATCHGLSAASGKLGAAFGAYAFPYLLANGDPKTAMPRAMFACALIAIVGLVVTYLFIPKYDAHLLTLADALQQQETQDASSGNSQSHSRRDHVFIPLEHSCLQTGDPYFHNRLMHSLQQHAHDQAMHPHQRNLSSYSLLNSPFSSTASLTNTNNHQRHHTSTNGSTTYYQQQPQQRGRFTIRDEDDDDDGGDEEQGRRVDDEDEFGEVEMTQYVIEASHNYAMDSDPEDETNTNANSTNNVPDSIPNPIAIQRITSSGSAGRGHSSMESILEEDEDSGRSQSQAQPPQPAPLMSQQETKTDALIVVDETEDDAESVNSHTSGDFFRQLEMARLQQEAQEPTLLPSSPLAPPNSLAMATTATTVAEVGHSALIPPFEPSIGKNSDNNKNKNNSHGGKNKKNKKR